MGLALTEGLPVAPASVHLLVLIEELTEELLLVPEKLKEQDWGRPAGLERGPTQAPTRVPQLVMAVVKQMQEEC